MLQLHSNRRQLSLHYGANAGTSGALGTPSPTAAANTAAASAPASTEALASHA